MSKKFRIIIDVEGGKQEAKISTSTGDEYIVDGLALFGDAEGDGRMFSFYWNRPDMAAKAVVKGCACAINRGDEITTQFYRSMLKGFCMATGTQAKQEVEPEDILSRWEEDLKIIIH